MATPLMFARRLPPSFVNNTRRMRLPTQLLRSQLSDGRFDDTETRFDNAL